MNYADARNGETMWIKHRLLELMPQLNFSAFKGNRTWVRINKFLELVDGADESDLIFLADRHLIQFDKSGQYIRLLDKGRRARMLRAS